MGVLLIDRAEHNSSAPVNLADYGEDFNRSNGFTMDNTVVPTKTLAGRSWSLANRGGGWGLNPKIVDGTVGSGDVEPGISKVLSINAGTVRRDVVVRVAKAPTDPATATNALALMYGVDSVNAMLYVSLRESNSKLTYTLARLSSGGGTVTEIGTSDIVPASGDVIWGRVRDRRALVYINGELLWDTTIPVDIGTYCGLIMRGSDQVTRFDDFCIYRR